MGTYSIPFPDGFSPVHAYEFGHAPSRQIAASLAMLAEIAHPGQWKSPQELTSAIYEQYCGPDLPTNPAALTREQALAWLAQQGINTIDLSARYGASLDDLKHEMQAQNLSGVAQLILLRDETPLRHATTLQPLHNWLAGAPGKAASIIRVGYSDDAPYALYLDSALSPAFSQPVPILWPDVEQAGLLSVIAVLPHGVEAPPPEFRYFAGVDESGHMLPPNPWPVPVPPKPEINVEEISTTLSAAQQAIQALQLAHQSILQSLGRG